MHKFTPSGLDKSLCITCKRPMRDHTSIAQCEVCPKLGPCELIGDILFCKSCYDKEQAALAQSKAEAEQRVIDSKNTTLEGQKAIQPMSPESLLARSQKIDQSIQMSQDIYNAKTIELNEILKAIDADSTIANKPFAKAKVTYERIETFQKAIFDYEQQLIDAKIGLRQSKEYLNQIINELHESEREKFRVKDITYPVKPVKTPKVKSPGTKKAKQTTKINHEEIAKWAGITGLSRDAIHAQCVTHGIGAKGAARLVCALSGKEWNIEWDKL